MYTHALWFCINTTTLEIYGDNSKSSSSTNFFIEFVRVESIPRQASWYLESWVDRCMRQKIEMSQRYKDHIWFWKCDFLVIKERAVKNLSIT